MKDQLWNLFRETGEPMGYLLYKARKQSKPAPKQQKPQKPAENPPAKA